MSLNNNSCQKCGEELLVNAVFCMHCGYKAQCSTVDGQPITSIMDEEISKTGSLEDAESVHTPEDEVETEIKSENEILKKYPIWQSGDAFKASSSDDGVKQKEKSKTSHSVIRDVVVPDIGECKDAEVIEILVQTDQAIQLDQSVVTLETEKASMEVPSPYRGVVRNINLSVSDTVETGDVILEIETQVTKTSERHVFAEYDRPVGFSKEQKTAAKEANNILEEAKELGNNGTHEQALAVLESVSEIPNIHNETIAESLMKSHGIKSYELRGRKGKKESALKDLKKIIGLSEISNKIRAEAYGKRGDIYRLEDRYEQSIRDYDMCIALARPGQFDSVSAYRWRADVKLDIGDRHGALDDFIAAIKSRDSSESSVYSKELAENFGLIPAEKRHLFESIDTDNMPEIVFSDDPQRSLDEILEDLREKDALQKENAEEKCVLLPDLGDSSEIKLTKLYVSAGQSIKADQPLIEVETEDIVVDVRSPYSGDVKEINVHVGNKLSPNAQILVLEKWSDEDREDQSIEEIPVEIDTSPNTSEVEQDKIESPTGPAYTPAPRKKPGRKIVKDADGNVIEDINIH